MQGLRAQLVYDRDTAVAPGNHACQHRSDPLRRLRPAAGLHHLHAVEPVSRGAGSACRASSRIRSTCAISIIRTGAGSTTAGSAGLVAGRNLATGPPRGQNCGANAATSISPAPLGAPRRHGVQSVSRVHRIPERRPGSAQRLYARGAADRPHHRQPSGPVPGDHALLQPGARRLAGRCRGRP